MIASSKITSKENILLLILLIFYTVGTVGILLPEYREFMLRFSAMNLFVSMIILILSRKNHVLPFWRMLAICFVVGIIVELIGTRTGLLFGNYAYGANLGPKVFGVPWIIGVNWGILVVCSASWVNRLQAHLIIKALLAALIMTALDLIIEPVAIDSDFWTWKSAKIPIYNYICWFAIAFPLQWLNFKLKAVESNKVANGLLVIMTLFFLILNIW
jgi:putative membrane protein